MKLNRSRSIVLLSDLFKDTDIITDADSFCYMYVINLLTDHVLYSFLCLSEVQTWCVRFLGLVEFLGVTDTFLGGMQFDVLIALLVVQFHSFTSQFFWIFKVH